MNYYIKSKEGHVNIGLNVFTTTLQVLVFISINESIYNDLFLAVENKSLLIFDNEYEILNGLPVMSGFIQYQIDGTTNNNIKLLQDIQSI